MKNNSRQHIVFPVFLSKCPEFFLSENLKEHVKVTYYQSIDEIQKICEETVELIILEDKLYDQWSSNIPEKPPSGIIIIDSGKVETIPDSSHKIMAWVSMDQMSNQRWNFTLEQCLENVKLHNDREKLESIASQAAIAIGNSKLLDSIQILFDGFINASVKAIESRDPTTSGHSSRVATLTIALAETVDQLKTGRFANLSFTADQLSEIRYASLLHDFGKIGVRERVLVKSKKLYPEEQQALMDRFRLIRAMMELKSSKEQISYFLNETHEKALGKYDANSDSLQEKLEELDDYLKLILSANEPTVMAQEGFEKLQEIAQLTFQPPTGVPVCYLSEDELNSLSVKKGSLNEKDRQEIESHVTHTFNFLNIIPWSENLDRVPEIAHAHHEKLNGSGYPQQLTESEIPLESKMMTIADIYDALTAWDRPYKKAMPSERALNILNFEAKDKHIDPDLLEIFISAKLYSLVQRPS